MTARRIEAMVHEYRSYWPQRDGEISDEQLMERLLVAAEEAGRASRPHALLGKEVRVTLAHANAETGEEAVISTGTLLGFGEGGDVQVREEDGFVHYCWPLLDIEPVEDDPVSLDSGDST